MLKRIQIMVLLVCSSAYAMAQESSSFLAGVGAPNWRHYNPYSPTYYALPNAMPLFSPAGSQTPIRSPTGPFVSPPYYGSLQQSATLQNHLGLRQYQQHQQNEQERRATPLVVKQQRNEGNFYRRLTSTPSPSSTTKTPHQSMIKLSERSAATFENKVLHVTTPITPTYNEDHRNRRSFASVKSFGRPFVFEANSTINQNVSEREEDLIMRRKDPNDGSGINSTGSNGEAHDSKNQRTIHSFHDIFMLYTGPQSVSFGHIENQPFQFAKRFESLLKGNRYRGEVTWADAKTGGYGSQHWDLVQGKLSSR